MPTRILATLLALALTGIASLTAPAAERTDYITQIKQPQGDASTAQDPLVKQTLNQHYPVNADASERLARISDGAPRECHYIRSGNDEYCMTLHSEKPLMAHGANAATCSFAATISVVRTSPAGWSSFMPLPPKTAHGGKPRACKAKSVSGDARRKRGNGKNWAPDTGA